MERLLKSLLPNKETAKIKMMIQSRISLNIAVLAGNRSHKGRDLNPQLIVLESLWPHQIAKIGILNY